MSGARQIQNKLVGLELQGNVVPTPGDCVHFGKPQVGIKLYKSPILGKVIALARVDVVHSEIGTVLEIGRLDGDQLRLARRSIPILTPRKNE